jgi:hypothetical protein
MTSAPHGCLRVGVVADYAEERWPSMDLVADMVGRFVPANDPGISVDTLRPPFVRRLGGSCGQGRAGSGRATAS